MNPITAFANMRQELTRAYHLPLPATMCIKGLTGIHWVWWLCRKQQLIKPEHIVPATLGSLLEGGLKFTPQKIEESIRAIAKLILIATRIDESLQRIQSLSQAFIDLKEALSGNYPLIIEHPWIAHPKTGLLSIHTFHRWQTFGREKKAFIVRIYYCFIRIFSKTFKLGMQLWDTYHAFVFSHDAIPELFVNSMYWFRKIRNNKDYINSKLEEHRYLLQKLFEVTKASANADQLIDRTKNILNGMVKGVEIIQDVNQAAGENIVKPVKKAIFVMKSKLLVKELKKPRAHTPFVLKKKPNLQWEPV